MRARGTRDVDGSGFDAMDGVGVESRVARRARHVRLFSTLGDYDGACATSERARREARGEGSMSIANDRSCRVASRGDAGVTTRADGWMDACVRVVRASRIDDGRAGEARARDRRDRDARVDRSIDRDGIDRFARASSVGCRSTRACGRERVDDDDGWAWLGSRRARVDDDDDDVEVTDDAMCVLRRRSRSKLAKLRTSCTPRAARMRDLSRSRRRWA